MNKYAVIDIGGKQLRVEQGRFHDAQHFAPVRHSLTSNMKISINRVLLIRHGSGINFGYPWLDDAAVRGRILHGCFKKKLVIQRIHSKKKKQRTFGYRENATRFVADSIDFGGKDLNRS
uniref:Large ribosomal subunit protein bL21c n=2 Tax=Dryopteris TaxID=3287 RepID=A0A977SNU5_9MONI|nr:ribosomal protein L21 [Dryopteris gaoligongensis]YP_010518532.1 ribosomal protein L21 [Dryopteris sinonepalensis]UYP50662.1 ribosomal protein L21 [Dryopteris cacaina]UXN84783.1 ribosomal protein L21 [Dryopteris gaoligongensis]UXN84959.1 ribosomal protein L21 [Dryopteris gaoligongensis]UXN85047.1 ribosomal protein L21 [Dryopteris sinonepalensis]UXN85223.1 ribosomal protein L21 [Dryopteris sinonepalensis]